MSDYKADPNNPYKSIPKGSDEGFTPQSGSDGFFYHGLPTTDPLVTGSLWISGSQTNGDGVPAGFLMVSGKIG